MQWLAKIALIFTIILSGCSAAQQSDYNAGNTTGINHTEYEISGFTINGAGGSIGGYTCCAMIPKKWTPELRAHISWDTLNTKGLPPPPNFNKVDDFKKWEQNVKDRTQYHKTIVPIAQYDKSCGLQVHFLPCNEVKVVSSCFTYGMQEYPIKAPRNMKEPAVCPK